MNPLLRAVEGLYGHLGRPEEHLGASAPVGSSARQAGKYRPCYDIRRYKFTLEEKAGLSQRDSPMQRPPASAVVPYTPSQAVVLAVSFHISGPLGTVSGTFGRVERRISSMTGHSGSCT